MSAYAKRPMSPFVAFCYANRDDVKAANPTANFGDLGRLLADLWKKTRDGEKALCVDHCLRDASRNQVAAPQNDLGLRRSARLRNKRLGLDFWGLKNNNKK
jgi:HMG (high mobility group) box